MMGLQCFPDDPGKFRKPDVSMVRSERMAGIDPKSGFLQIPPDLAVEVLSPNSLACDIAVTVDDYLLSSERISSRLDDSPEYSLRHRPPTRWHDFSSSRSRGDHRGQRYPRIPLQSRGIFPRQDVKQRHYTLLSHLRA
jgi:putative restriction endonuclease